MAKSERQEKIKFARELYKKGITVPAEIQRTVKEKYGGGIAFIDLKKVFPAKKGGKKKTSKRDGTKKAGKKTVGRKTAGRPRKKGGRRGRPVGDQWILLVGDETELHGAVRHLQNRVAELISEGIAQESIAIYEKTSMEMTIRTDITI